MVGADWAVILDRSTNEFAKTRSVDKLSEAFNLTPEEAKDLAENTPIVLLDQLPLDVAEKIKDYFAQSNVDCSLTNDTFTKRKCFRAIWPTQPDLNQFLSDSAEPAESETFLPTTQGIEEELKDLTRDIEKENEIKKAELEKKETAEKVIPLESALRQSYEEQLNSAKQENQALTVRITELERSLNQLKQSSEKELKTQLGELKTQLDHYKSEYTRTQNIAKTAQQESKQFQTEFLQAQKTLSQARSEMEDLKRMLSQVQTDSVQLKEETDQLRRQLEIQTHDLKEDLDEWKRKANDWSANYFKVIKENEFLRAHHSEELEAVKVRNQQLGVQLEVAQRQIREFVGQLEQQDLIQKRMKAASEMAEREAQLKLLVQKQRTLEDEIRARDEEMKKVLSEQEALERAIINSKQAQKYLMEQSKLKEKSRGVRPKIVNPGASIPQETHEGEAGRAESESND